MPSLNVNDSGTWRKLKKLPVNDSGTWRYLKSLWANDSGTWRKIFQSGVDFNLTAESDDDPGPATFRGYIHASSGTPFGSVSASDDGDGHTIYEITVALSTSRTRLQISGFGADPGVGHVIELINNTSSITKTVASNLFSYSYGSGFAVWTFTGAIFTTTGTFAMTLSAG